MILKFHQESPGPLTADELIRVEIDWFLLTDCEAFVTFGGFGITERESSESDSDSL